MNTEKTAIKFIKEYGLLTVASVLIIVSTWLFKYPNNFAFGGVNGLSILLSKIIAHFAPRHFGIPSLCSVSLRKVQLYSTFFRWSATIVWDW